MKPEDIKRYMEEKIIPKGSPSEASYRMNHHKEAVNNYLTHIIGFVEKSFADDEPWSVDDLINFLEAFKL